MSNYIKTDAQHGLSQPLEEKMLKTHNLADRKWRLNNLYHVLNEQRDLVQFGMRPLQEDFYNKWWYRNMLLKSRQIGGCLDGHTVVLTADLKWVPIKDIKIGDELVACDEHAPGGKGAARKMRTTTVEATRSFIADERVKITFDDGRTLICTPDHPWLSRKSGTGTIDWRSVDNSRSDSYGKIKIGNRVRSICTPWGESTYEDGYFSGVLDADGCVNIRPANGSVSLEVTQQENDIMARCRKYCNDKGFRNNTCLNKGQHADTYHRNADVFSLNIGCMEYIFQIHGQCRPCKLEGKRWWEGRDLPGKRDAGKDIWPSVVSIESIGSGEVVDIQTSTKTFIAEGFVSHNSTLIQLSGLDGAVFIPNFKTVIISHKKDSAADLLEENALLPYMNLHPEIRSRVKLVDNNKTTLTFSNGSSVEVTNSGRSGNGNFLHISEFGYIAAKRPDIAREIIAGTLPGFHQGAMVFIESTAEGSDGQFYDMCKTAENMKLQGKHLTEMDFKFHFYGWQDRPQNSLTKEDAEHVEIPQRLQQYFEGLRTKEGIVTTHEQQAWYTVQERTLKQDMKKEQPATPKEAFESSGEGKILALQMAQMREDKRITEVPVVAGRPIYTFWDLGLNDETAVAFMQNVGTSWYCVKYMEATDDGLIEWVRRVREIAIDNRWNLADWVGPHDLKKRSGATGQTIWDETAYATGIKFKVVPKVAVKKVAIDKLRGKMSVLRIDEVECEQLIKHMDKYRWEYDDSRAVYKDRPYHGPESNACDAMQTWAMWTAEDDKKAEQLAMGRPDKRAAPNGPAPTTHRSMRGFL